MELIGALGVNNSVAQEGCSFSMFGEVARAESGAQLHVAACQAVVMQPGAERGGPVEHAFLQASSIACLYDC